ncbi:MAG: hypothetical protein ACMXYC_01995 [Candidatus Woesearchaeota archaeon]
MTSIHSNIHFKNMAIDKESIAQTTKAQIGNASIHGLSVDKAYTHEHHDVFKEELLLLEKKMRQQTYDQLLDLAKQFSEYAKKVDKRLDELEQKILYQAPVRQTAQPKQNTLEGTQSVDTPIDRNDVAPADVSIEKMFNFSNKPIQK